MSRTHRCPDCGQSIEHEEDELCPSCGRCTLHCRVDTHERMQPVKESR